MIQSINPATGEVIESLAPLPDAELAPRVDRAVEAQRSWRQRPYEERAAVLHAVADAVEAAATDVAPILSREMGKPIRQAEGEVEKSAWVCRYYADHGAGFLTPETVVEEGFTGTIHYPPLGVILAIMPWNFPVWQVLRCAAPALMAGCGVLLKHAPGVPGVARRITELLHEAGVPTELFQNLPIAEAQVPAIISHPGVAAVTLTGSTRAGRAVAAEAGRHLKKCVLELGGSDPYVVLADADLDRAVRACVSGRFLNTGQSCIAAKRWIVVEEVRPAFEARVEEALQAYVPGDPMDPDTRLGPLARVDLRDALHRQVEASVAAGARLVLGGRIPDRAGAWYPATLLTDVRPGQPAYTEELFGPVAAVLPARDDADALRIANDTEFGLGGAVFTKDLQRGLEVAVNGIEAGCVAVNDFVRSDPRLPFGGIRSSGFGRELGRAGLLEFVNIKAITCRRSP